MPKINHSILKDEKSKMTHVPDPFNYYLVTTALYLQSRIKIYISDVSPLFHNVFVLRQDQTMQRTGVTNYIEGYVILDR